MNPQALLYYYLLILILPEMKSKVIFWNFKKKSNFIDKPFFALNDSFNLKNEHCNSIEKKKEQKQEHLVVDPFSHIALTP